MLSKGDGVERATAVLMRAEEEREQKGDGAEVDRIASKRKARSGPPILERQARDRGSFATCSGISH